MKKDSGPGACIFSLTLDALRFGAASNVKLRLSGRITTDCKMEKFA